MNMVIYHPGIAKMAKMAFPGTEPNTQDKKVSVGQRGRQGEKKNSEC